MASVVSIKFSTPVSFSKGHSILKEEGVNFDIFASTSTNELTIVGVTEESILILDSNAFNYGSDYTYKVVEG